jgi:hypothetical protein
MNPVPAALLAFPVRSFKEPSANMLGYTAFTTPSAGLPEKPVLNILSVATGYLTALGAVS